MNLSLGDFNNFSLAFVVPDTFSNSEILEMCRCVVCGVWLTHAVCSSGMCYMQCVQCEFISFPTYTPAQLHRLFLDHFKVHQIFLHRESVVSCFGCGRSSGLVVDMGAHKTFLACVKEGGVVQATRRTLHIGGE
jgi:hypothetical protein